MHEQDAHALHSKQCSRCEQFKPLAAFSNHRSTRDGKQSMCRACNAEWQREYRRRNPEAVRRTNLKYHRSERGQYMKRTNERAKRYGLTREQMLELAARPCAICGAPSAAIDHDHTTGKVRGALCRECNLGLGHFRDRPDLLEAAAGYLKGA